MIKLYPHQEEAVAWMRATEQRARMVASQPHGGILAHAMGLGKTLTMLSLIRAQDPCRTLVVCPKSLLVQWKIEAQRVGWTADTLCTYHGMGRAVPAAVAGVHQLVFTTFDIVRLEHARAECPLHATVWSRVVLDEAHRICEQSSKTARAILALRASNRWCITGTPFKNGMGDLMALSRFLMVSPYCNISWWRRYGNSIPKLREWRHLFLHMCEKTVLSLPPIQHNILEVDLPARERELYVQLHDIKWKVRVDDAGATAHDQHELLRILRQRQTANHPMLLAPIAAMRFLVEKGGYRRALPVGQCAACGTCAARSLSCGHALCAACGDEPICAACIAANLSPVPGEWLHSAKTRRLWSHLRDVTRIQTTDTKVVLFSQWTTCLDLLGWMLDHEGVGHARYDGRVNSADERAAVIEHFRVTPTCKVLLTSLGAGGEGVNLTFASLVVLMEPYWNMASEQQAIDRLHRIGQTGTTHVVRMQIKDSVEEWVQSIQVRKSNELQRLLYDKIVADSDASKPTTRKRVLTQGLRPAFENAAIDGGTVGCLGDFLVSKQPRLA